MEHQVMPKTSKLLNFLLFLSLSLNILLFYSANSWEKAWLAQILTTADIENILKKSGADISFESIHAIAMKEYPSSCKVIALEKSDMVFSSDEKAISITGTKLIFKNEIYLGSKSELPTLIPLLSKWWLHEEFYKSLKHQSLHSLDSF